MKSQGKHKLSSTTIGSSRCSLIIFWPKFIWDLCKNVCQKLLYAIKLITLLNQTCCLSCPQQDNDLSEFDESREIIESLVDEYKAWESPDYIKWGMEVKDIPKMLPI